MPSSVISGVKSQLKDQKNEAEKKMVSGIATGSVGSGIRRRRKRRSELLSREEIVNCVCGSPEEEGLMMQVIYSLYMCIYILKCLPQITFSSPIFLQFLF